MPALLDRRTIAAVDGRIDRTGDEVVPLDMEQVRSGVTHLVEEEGIEALAVSFLWSFANRSHEERAVAAARVSIPTSRWSRGPSSTRPSANTSGRHLPC